MILGHLTVASRKLVSVSRLSIVVVLALVLTSVYSITRVGVQHAQAAAPATLNFQGRLLASSGNLVPDGQYNIEFKIFNDATGSGSSQGSCTGDVECLWTETRTGAAKVEVKNGYFSAYLGDVSALPTNIWNQQLWLTMNIGGTSGPTWDGEMTPRIRLTSVPYAFRATIAESSETLYKNTGSFAGTVEFSTMTADRKFLFPDTSLATTASPGTICVFNGTSSNCPAATGSAFYIQNTAGSATPQTAANFNIQATDSGANGTVAGILRGAAAGQTVDLLQFQSSGGTVLGAVTAAGNLQVASSVDTRTAGTLSIGTSTATGITLGKAGVTTTNAGALTVSELLTANAGLTASGGAISLTGNAASSLTTSSGALTITSAAAAIWSTTAGNLTVDSAATLQLGVTNATGVTIGRNGITTTNGGNFQFAQGANRTLNVAANSTNAAGYNLTIAAGAAGTGASAFAGGALNLQGGAAAGTGNANGGDVVIQGGTGTGTGIPGVVYIDTPVFTAASTQTFGSNGTITQSVVDGNSTIPINATAASLTITLPAPGNATVGRIIYVTAVNGSNSYTIAPSGGTSFVMAANSTATFVWNGNAWTNAGVDGGSSSYIQNQSGSVQTGNFWISGTGRADTGITTPLVQTANAATASGLTIKPGNSTGANVAGAVLTLQGGAATSGNANGGDVSLQGGAGVGTGLTGQVVIGSAARFGTVNTGSINTDYTLTSAQVDNYTVVAVNMTGNNKTVTVPAPTITTVGRMLYITNVGTQTFTIAPTGGSSFLLNPGASSTFLWNGTAWTNAGVDAGSASFILNQIGSAQTTANFWISGTGRADTSMITPLLQTQDQTTGSTPSSALTIRTGNITVSSGNTSGAITIKTGDASSSNNSSGAITIDSGTANGSGTTGAISIGTANASAVTISKVGVLTRVDGNFTIGASAGSGTTFTNNGATVNTAKAVLNDSDGGQIGGTPGTPLTAAQSVDIYTSFTINQTTAGQTITLPSPTSAAAGRLIYIANIGSASFGLLGSTLNAGATATLMWNGSAWTFAGADGTSINNQSAAQQSGDFWISGTGRADTRFYSPLFDTATAVALGIGTTNATNISIGHNAGTFAVDGTNFDLSTLGVLTLAGGQTNDITTQANTNLTMQANGTGTIVLNDTTTANGTLTFNGVATDITTAANEDLTVVANGTGTIVLNDTVTVAGTVTFSGIATDITTGANEDLTVDANGTGRTILNDNVDISSSTSLATKVGTTFTAAGISNSAALNGAGFYLMDTSGGAQVINGITAGRDGQQLTLTNVDAALSVTLTNNSGSATGSKIITGSGVDVIIPVGGSASLVYDSANTVWRVVSGGTGSGVELQASTPGTAQTGNFNISGTGIAGTALYSPMLDTATAVALGIGTTNATNVTIGHNAGTFAVDGTNFDLSTLGVLTLAGGQTNDITTQANQNLTVQANGTGTIVLNDTITANGSLTFNGVATDITTASGEDLTVIANGAGTINLNDTVTVGGTMTFSGVATDITTASGEDLTVVANGAGSILLNDTVQVAGNFTVTSAGNVAFQRNTTDITATGTQTDLALPGGGTGALFRISSASALTINSIAGGADGRIITLINASSNPVTIANETGATAGNRILTGTGGTTLIPVDGTIQLAYDSGASRWRVIGGTAVSGGAANQQLSNLSGTIAINASLTPDGDNTRDLGSSAFSWRTLYADTSVLTPLVGRASSGTLSIGTDANSTAVSISRTGVNTRIYGTLTVDEAAGFTSNLTVANTGNVAFQANATNYTVTGTQELTIGSGVLHRVTSATSTPILTGLTGGADGRIITLVNASGNTLTIQNDSGGTATNRIITGSGINSLVPAGGSVQLAYDSAASRWRIIGSSGGDSIQLQATTPGTAQTGNFNVSGTGIAGTALYSPMFDTATAVALGIGTTNATNVTIGHNAGTFAVDGTNFDLSTAGVITLAGGQSRDITTATTGTATALTVRPGDSTTANIAGGALNLQGGSATAGNANGGAVTISGGAGFGTGTQGLVNLSTTAFTTSSVQTYNSAGTYGFNNPDNSIINNFSTIPVFANVTGVIVSVPDPAQNTIGRLVYVAARDGSQDFTLRLNAASPTPIDIVLKKNSTATLIWNGDEWTAAGASSSTDLQSAYNNTLTSAGGAEILLNPVGGNADGFTIRNNGTTPIVGGLLEVQSSTGSNLLSVNNNATEYAVNGGAETSTSFSTNWLGTPTGGSVSRSTGSFATGQAAVSVGTTATNHGARNILSAALSSGVTYSVSFTAKVDPAYDGFSTLQVVYSPDGTNTGTVTCATAQTVTKANWSRISCTFVASGSITSNNSIFIRQTDGTTRTFYVDNLSVQVNANMTFAAEGSVNSSLGTAWGTYNGAAPASQSTTVYDGQYAVSVAVTGAGQGVRNNMAVTPAINTQYLVTFYAKASTGTATIAAGFLPAGGNGAPAAAQQCVDYSPTQSVGSSWQRITCVVTTPGSGISDPDLVIYQTDGTSRTLYIDALTINLNTNNSNNVQVGGVNEGGPTTLLTLDRASSAPIAANNDAYLGSMYYDTTTGRIQCYEADGWGACGSSPDNIITLTPEYTGAVLGGPGNGQSAGIGVMTSEFCSNQAGVLTLGSLCSNREARNYYHWTSPQPSGSMQIYSIYVSYKLPSTFKEFNDSNTIKLTALSDNLTDAIATLQVFRKPSNPAIDIASCGSATTINTAINTWEQTSFGGDERACGFAPGDNIIFKIDMKAQNNGDIYVENLDFVYNNN